MGRVLGGALLFGCVGLLAKSFVAREGRCATRSFVLTNRDRVAAVLIGLFGGFVVGLTSVGSGVFFGLTLLVVFPLRAHKVVGTDIFHAAALLYVAGVGHWLAGNVDMGIVGWLLLGSIPGVLIGGRLSLSMPETAAPLRARDRARSLGAEADRRARHEHRHRRRARHRDDGAPRLHRAAQLDPLHRGRVGRVAASAPSSGSGARTGLLWTDVRTSVCRDAPGQVRNRRG